MLGTDDPVDDEGEATGVSDPDQETAEEESAGEEESRSKLGIFLILGGLVIAGIATGYAWVRNLPKD